MVVLAGREFSSALEIKAEFDSIRDRGDGQLTGESLRFVSDLVKFHPKFNSGCKVVVVGAHNAKGKPPHDMSNAIWVEYKDEHGVLREDTLAPKRAATAAFKGAVAGREGYERDHMFGNFRKAVGDQTYAFKLANVMEGGSRGVTIRCQECGACKKRGEVEVHHAGGDAFAFCSLVKGFIQAETELDPGFDEFAHFGRNTYDDTSEVVGRWMEYHRKRAQLQMLCKPCHKKETADQISRRSAPVGARAKRPRTSAARPNATKETGRRDAIIRLKCQIGAHPNKTNVAQFIEGLSAHGIECTPSQVYGAASGLKKLHTSS